MKDKRVLTLFLTILIDLIGFGIVIPVLPTLTKSIAARSDFFLGPDMAVGLVIFCFAIMQFLFSPFWGSYSDRIGRRPIILISIFIAAIGYIMLGFGQSLWVIFAARIVSGIGSANISAAQAYIADITPPHDRAKRMGLIGAAFGIGFVIGPPIGGWLFHLGEQIFTIGPAMLKNGAQVYPDGGLRMLGFFCAALAVINLIMAFFMLPESLTEKKTDKRKFLKSFEGFTTVWRLEVIGELFTINFIYVAAFMMMQIISAILWKERYGIDELHIGYIFGFIGFCSAVIQGGLIGVFQRLVGVKKMLIWGCPLVAVGLALVPLPSKEWFYPIQALSIICLTVGNGFLMPSINALVSINTSSQDQGKTLGLLQSFSSLARAAGPLLSTALYGYFYALPYIVATSLMILAFILALRLSKQIKNEDRPAGELT
jgi:multidrug resistance protein